SAAEPEPQGDGALRLEGEAGVVEVELVERVAEQWIVLAADRIDTGEHEALRRLVAGQGTVRGSSLGRDRVADLRLAHVLEPRGDIAALARRQLFDGHELWPEDAEFERFRCCRAAHEPDRVVGPER